MRFTSLGSGSRGNAMLVESGETCIVIDCGLPIRLFLSAIERSGAALENIDAIFITHEHGDHIKALQSVLRRRSIPVYMTRGTAEASDNLNLPELAVLLDLREVVVGNLVVTPVSVPHDAREPCQFVIRAAPQQTDCVRQKSLGILTDLGSCSPHVVDHFSDCDAYVLECNHDVQRLKAGPYPPSLKDRVLGDWGHLSNQQAGDILRKLGCDNLQWLVLAHISQQNNDPVLALGEISQVFPQSDKILVADQEHGFDWLELV